MMQIDRNTVIMRRQDILSAEIDGNTVLLGVDSGKYYGFNEIASRIWALTEKSTSADQIIQVLLQEYDVADDACEKQVMSFLNDINEAQLLQVITK